MNAPTVDYRHVVKQAKKAEVREARRLVEDALRRTPRMRTTRYACLLYARGLIAFREGNYEVAYVYHVRARHMWSSGTDEKAPRKSAENDLALFYTLVAAGRRRFAWPVLKLILNEDEVPFGDQLISMVVFVVGKRAAKLCWRTL